jgi:dethiobiotin synthetase
VFSPLGPGVTNFELALALEPATWVLVAADALGVLHDVSATLRAMRACGREPEHLVLSGAREPDASTGSNATELATLGIARPSAVLARDDDRGVSDLLERLLDDAARRVQPLR